MNLNNNTTTVDYQAWNPSQGDFKKVYAEEDSRKLRKRIRRSRIANISLFSLYFMIAAASFYYFLFA